VSLCVFSVELCVIRFDKKKPQQFRKNAVVVFDIWEILFIIREAVCLKKR